MKKIIFVLLGLLSTVAYSQRVGNISEGMWFNPNASGRGVTIEIQNGTIVATYFGYKDNGEPIWWQGNAIETATNQFSDNFYTFSNGQCVGCNFSQAEPDFDQSIGQFTLSFLNSNDLILTWAGGSETLIKYDYGYGSVLDYAYGVWMVSGFFSDLNSIGETVLMFYDESDNDNGTRFLIGNRSGYQGTANYLAVAMHYEAGINGRDAVSILLDSSTSYYRFYLVNITENGFEGRSWLYRKDEQLSGSGLLAKGMKHWDKYELSQRIGSFKLQPQAFENKRFDLADERQYLLPKSKDKLNISDETINAAFQEARIILESTKQQKLE